jgi:hypothetical protein
MRAARIERSRSSNARGLGHPDTLCDAIAERVSHRALSPKHKHHITELAALLHSGDHVMRAQQHLLRFIRDLIAEGAKKGALRADLPPDELARYCLHALTAAASVPSQAAVRRLVTVNLSTLRPSR